MAEITGTGLNDSLTGTQAADLIRGLGGRDVIFGLGGDDRIEGGDGDDLLIGDLGDDVLLGGIGDDTLGESTGRNDDLFGEAGNDHLYYYGTASSPAADALLDGGTGDDLLRYNQFNQNTSDLATLIGGGGYDRIESVSWGGGHITIDAGAGADLVEIINNHADYDIALGSGSDLLLLGGEYQFSFLPGTDIVISDFAAGDNGDALSLIPYLAKELVSWDFADNPFAVGYLRVEQRGADAVIQIDRDSGAASYGFHDFIVLQGVSAAALTARNLSGYASSGSATVGVTIDGLVTPDLINGTSGNDVLRGHDGNDGLFGSAGDDLLEGGAGDDTLDGEFGDDVVHGGDGNDELSDTFDGSDQFYGGEGNDSLFVDRQWFVLPLQELLLDGGGGNDQISFMSTPLGHDATLIGGAGNDTISAYLGRNVTIDAGEGDDFVSLNLGIGNALVTLGAGIDTVQPTLQGAPVVAFTITDFQAGDGGDKFYLLPVLQVLLEGWDIASNPFAEGFLRVAHDGADTVLLYDPLGEGTAYNVLGRLTGADAGQLTAFNFGHDFGTVAIVGTNEADTLVGGESADELIGLAGNDTLIGGAGGDVMSGGGGNDTYFVDDIADVAAEAAGAGTDTVRSDLASFALPDNVENLILRAGALAGIGNDLGNVMTGNEAGNELVGRGGNDTLKGNEGGDTLRGQDGDDALWGGLGHDDLFGGGGADTLEGDGGNDRVYGNAGDDFVNGGLGNDNVFGGGGNDNLQGGNGADILNGHAGNDLIVGGPGNDLLVGGPGADRFLFNPGHLGGGLSATDRVKDFSQVQGDLIDLHNLDADTTTGGNQAFSWIGGAAFSGAAGELRFAFAGNTTTVTGDTDGDGAADFALWLTGQIGLVAGDFVL